MRRSRLVLSCPSKQSGGHLRQPLIHLDTSKTLEEGTEMSRLNCRDPDAAVRMGELIENPKGEGLNWFGGRVIDCRTSHWCRRTMVRRTGTVSCQSTHGNS